MPCAEVRLRLAAALREGAEARLRDGLAENAPETPADELDRLMGILDRLEPAPQRPERGGRPTGPRGRSTALASGVRLSLGP